MTICVGITGSNGAGKGSVVEHLIALSKGAAIHYSMRDMIIAITQDHYGVTIEDRDDLREYANRLRADFNSAVLVETACGEIKILSPTPKLVIIESLRCIGEVDYLARTFGKNFSLIAVDAKPRLRFNRITNRGDMTDQVTFGEFCTQEALEAANEDPWKQNVWACIERAKYLVENNGTPAELQNTVEFFYPLLVSHEKELA